MNNEQNDNDTLVSATYRESAQETTPPHLDEAVLRMAAKQQSAPKWGGFSAWMRPLTWTVTAGLVAAIVINVPLTEDTTVPQAAESVSPAASIEEAFAADNANVVEEAEKMASLRDGPDQPASVARSRQEQAKRLDEDESDAAVASRSYGVAAPVSADAVTQEIALEKKESSNDPACDETWREQAETWYECVVELREGGRTEDANREMLELVEQFPDFQPE